MRPEGQDKGSRRAARTSDTSQQVPKGWRLFSGPWRVCILTSALRAQVLLSFTVSRRVTP